MAECDTLVIESTFGHPRYAFPPKEQVLAQIEAWCRDHLARGVAPILLGYPLGKSQEAMKYLTSRGLRIAAHASIHDMTALYRECGMAIDNVRRFDGTLEEGEVGFFPPRSARTSGVAKLWPRATAVLTGWAVDAGVAQRYGADVAFPLSDHADFPSLMKYVKDTGATEVVTCHGFARELAQALRDDGIDARPVGVPQQLALL